MNIAFNPNAVTPATTENPKDETPDFPAIANATFSPAPAVPEATPAPAPAPEPTPAAAPQAEFKFEAPAIPAAASIPAPALPAPVAAPAITPPTQLAHSNPVWIPKGFEGDFEARDFGAPWITIVQGNGDLSERFTKGNWVFQKSFDLGPSFHAVVTHVTKRFKSDLPWDERSMSQTYDTAAQARQSGEKTFPFCEVSFLIVLPKDHPAASGCENVLGEYAFVTAMYTTSKTSTRPVLALANLGKPGKFLEHGMTSGIFKVSAKRVPGASFSYFVPEFIEHQSIDPSSIAAFC